MESFWLVDVFVFVFGLTIGSFLNVCIYRLPRGMSVAGGRSRCPSCDTVLIRVAQIQGDYWLDMRGVRVLHISAGA